MRDGADGTTGRRGYRSTRPRRRTRDEGDAAGSGRSKRYRKPERQHDHRRARHGDLPRVSVRDVRRGGWVTARQGFVNTARPDSNRLGPEADSLDHRFTRRTHDARG